MKLFNRMLRRFVKVGRLTVIDVSGKAHIFGPGGKTVPHSRIRLTDKKLYRQLFLHPELCAGEAYMEGTLVCEEGGIRELLELFALNRDNLRQQPMQKALHGWLKKIRRWHQRNEMRSARRNVQHHYDLSNDFYKLFLDKDMQYSCAYWSKTRMNLEDAQNAKKAHIAAKLNLKPGMRVLDIGCGWGGMAIYLAEHFECEVVGITLSDEQMQLAQKRIKAKKLSGRIDIRIQDYRVLEEKFDRIVSVGMFEHVGIEHYYSYFRKIHDLLTTDGVALVHSIGRKGGPGATGAWIRKYIFPGGYSPALSETLSEVEKSGLWVNDCEILRLHYARTLAEWNKRFQKNRKKVMIMFDEKFCRMWEFYLATSEFAFLYGNHMNFQLQLTKRVDALPICRDYIERAERALIAEKKQK